MEIDTSQTVSRLKANKGWLAVALVAAFLLYFVGSLFSGGFRSVNNGLAYSQELAMSKSFAVPASMDTSALNGGGASKPIVKRASLEVKSDSAKKDESRVTDRVKAMGGFVDSVSDSDSDNYLYVTLSVRVPSEKFDSFVEYLRDSFDVKSSSIDLYRISLQTENDELAILQTTMDTYNDLFKKAEAQASLDSETLTFLADITNKKLDVMRQMRQYGYSLESKQEDVAYSTLTISLAEEKPVKFVKEGFWRNFELRLRDTVERVLDSLTGMVTDTVAIFVYVVQVGLTLIVIAVPIRFTLRILGKIFNVKLASKPEVSAAARHRQV